MLLSLALTREELFPVFLHLTSKIQEVLSPAQSRSARKCTDC